MLIYFARHGQTDHNVQGIIQGNLDTPLNEQGRVEARLLAKALKDVPFIEARSSHLSRAFETAQTVVEQHSADLELIPDPGLRERSLGSLEGRRWTPGYGIPADAEQSAVFRKRVREWAEAFFASHTGSGQTDASQPEPIVLCVSHGAFLSALLGVLQSPPFLFKPAPGVDIKKPCLNTSIMRVRVYFNPSSGWEGNILSWAEVAHMGGKESKIGVSDDLRASLRKAMAHGE